MTTDRTAGPIPSLYVEFCKHVAEQALQAGFEAISLTIRPGFYQSGEQWSDPIIMNWTQGRHGEDSRNLAITSHVTVHANLDQQQPTNKGAPDA